MCAEVSLVQHVSVHTGHAKTLQKQLTAPPYKCHLLRTKFGACLDEPKYDNTSKKLFSSVFSDSHNWLIEHKSDLLVALSQCEPEGSEACRVTSQLQDPEDSHQTHDPQNLTHLQKRRRTDK